MNLYSETDLNALIFACFASLLEHHTCRGDYVEEGKMKINKNIIFFLMKMQFSRVEGVKN